MTRIPRPSIPDDYDPTPIWLGALPPEVGFESLSTPLLSIGVAKANDYIIYNHEGESERVEAESALKALEASSESAPVKIVHALCTIGFVFQKNDLKYESLTQPQDTDHFYAPLLEVRQAALEAKGKFVAFNNGSQQESQQEIKASVAPEPLEASPQESSPETPLPTEESSAQTDAQIEAESAKDASTQPAQSGQASDQSSDIETPG